MSYYQLCAPPAQRVESLLRWVQRVEAETRPMPIPPLPPHVPKDKQNRLVRYFRPIAIIKNLLSNTSLIYNWSRTKHYHIGSKLIESCLKQKRWDDKTMRIKLVKNEGSMFARQWDRKMSGVATKCKTVVRPGRGSQRHTNNNWHSCKDEIKLKLYQIENTVETKKSK